MAESKENINAKFILTILTIVGLAIGCAIWATSAHAEIKDWASTQDFVTRSELKEIMKEQYVPMTKFVKVETQLERAIKDNQRILESLHEVNDKLDVLKKRR